MKMGAKDEKPEAFHHNVFERALFVVGEQNAGKSVQLRSMLRDVQLDGVVRQKVNLPEMYRLSNERILYLRLSSPHEKGDSLIPGDPDNYLDKTLAKFINEGRNARRWNFANALQPHASNKMPNVVDTVAAFVARLQPERTRVVFLSPDQFGSYLQEEQSPLAKSLQGIDSVEVCWIDAQDRLANGLMLADFFDFT